MILSHEEQKERLAAHALGALDELEAREVGEHLMTCDECRTEFEDWRATTSALALTVPAAEPSAALRTRILETVRAEGSSQSSTERRANAGRDAVGDSSAPSNIVVMSEASRFVRRSLIVYGAIAASLIITALAVSLFITWRRLNETREYMARYERAVGSLAKEAEREREAREILTSPQSRSATLAGTSAAPGAHARLAFDSRTGHAMLIAYNLPPAPTGKAYQLWFISGGQVMPGKVFTPDTRGSAMIDEQVPVEKLDAAPVFAVTLEPSAGVSAPTGEKYLLSAAS